MSADQGEQPKGRQSQNRRNTPQSGGGFGQAPQSPTQRYAMFGIAVYGAYAIVRFLHDFLEAILSHDESMYFQASDNPLYSASNASFFANNDQIMLLVALAIGAFYVYSVTTTEPAYKPAAIAASAGIAAVSVVSMVLILLFTPDGVTIELGNEIIGLLVAIVGSAIAAAVTAVVLERAPKPTPR